MQVSDLSKTHLYPKSAANPLWQAPESGKWTATEIAQQPTLWRELQADFKHRQAQLSAFLNPLLAKDNLRIILTGAGTSAYIGEALAAFLQRQLRLPGQRVEALSSTDIVSHPRLHLNPLQPTLIVSYGRSGNSPESLAVLALADELLTDVSHLLLTCNPEGALASYAAEHSHKACLWLMPQDSHDRSFAMTSSFSCMYLATLLLFAEEDKSLSRVLTLTEQLLETRLDEVQQTAAHSCKRIVFLGAGPLKAAAQEAALKYLELTAGIVISSFESPLGFRHGPKSLVNEDTQIVLLGSSEPYARAYDLDLLAELRADKRALDICYLSEEALAQDGQASLEEAWLTLPFIVYCQLLAFYKALELGVSADNPCPSGQVNRVVQGVKLHSLAVYTRPGSRDNTED